MSWPPPTLLPPPDVDDAVPQRSPSGLSGLTTATWLSLLGSGLLLTAAVAVVVSNWETIGQGLRVGGLAAVTSVLLAIAQRIRPVVPTTAGVLAHVGTALIGFVGIAAMSLAGFTWPACILVGGTALSIGAGWQSARWRRDSMATLQVVGFALMSAGLGTLWSAPAGLLAAAAGAILVATGLERRGVTLSIAAVCAPALAALADAGIGAGVLARTGVVGDQLGWSGPMVGVLAALTIGAVGLRRRNSTLILLAVASPVLGLVTGFAALGAPAAAWWTLPGLGLLGLEVAVRWLGAGDDDGIGGQVLDLTAGSVAAILWLSPVLVSFGAWATDDAGTWAIPTALAAIAVGASTLRWHIRNGRPVDAGLAALAASVVAVALTFDVGPFWLAAVAVAGTAAATSASRRLSPIAIHGSAIWALFAIATVAGEGAWSAPVGFALLAVLAAIVIASRTRLASSNGLVGWVEMAAFAWLIALTATSMSALPDPTVALVAIAILVLAVSVVEPRFAVWSVLVTGVCGIAALDAASADGALDQSIVIGWVAITVGFLAQWSATRNRVALHAAVSSGVVALATSATWFEVDAATFTLAAMASTVALTGIWIAVRHGLVASAALTAGTIVLVTTSFPLDPIWASVAWVVVGLQLTIGGTLWRSRPVIVAGLVTATGGLIDLWSTSGLHDWFVEVLAPADITATDVWFALLVAIALVAGEAIRRRTGLSSWATHSAGLAMVAIWLVPVHVDRGPAWTLPLLVTFGVGAVVFGAWQRLGAPLVLGSLLTLTALALAVGTDLRAVPTWVWLALGGTLLMAAAAVVERRGRVGLDSLKSAIERWG